MQMAEAAVITSRGDYFRSGLFGADGPMYGTGMRRLLAYNSTRIYSPITMNTQWSTLMRLTTIVFLSVVGTLANGFFVSSFFIENPLKRLGNVYLACVGIADIIITAGVMPTSAVVLLSGIWDMPTVCYGLQFATETSVYCYTFFFIMIAIENYVRICNTRACYARFLSIPVSLISCLIFLIGFTVAGFGVYLNLDYDYCDRLNNGNYYFRLCTSVLFQAIPFGVTIILLTTASQVVRARARRLIHYKRSQQFDRDYQFTNLNICGYLLFVLAWIPYLVIVNKYPNSSDASYYSCVWIGLSRSIVTSFLYSGLNRNFRRAFSHLFYYCCCKSSLASPFNSRPRTVFKPETGDLRVHMHIMHLSVGKDRAGGAGCSRDCDAPEL